MKISKIFLIEIIVMILGTILIILICGCSFQVQPIPKSIFSQKTIFEKPKQVSSIEEINQNYLELFKAYKHNLLLIDYLEKLNESK